MTDPTAPPAAPQPGAAYRVLARKYRPQTFRDLIGQEAMVRILTNAIASGRLAHAFMLTGVRGVGKTTTARIIARGLNCIGPDGQGGITADPCGVCANCVAIAEDRHVDVLEMDAASRTGVDDIRELIESVRYRPVGARYKVYIVDEVHMLSKPAFNALLKTLEEPPAHVKFVFATTEIRKIPVTVLSRCQRFDLRRVESATLARHFARIAEAEGFAVAPAALALIARAADGSVRDGLSLLDQAMALAEGEIGEQQVRDMLGLADRTQLFELFERVMRGEVPAALGQLGEMYAAGADPAALLQDLLELTHWLTRLKLVPEAADDPTVPEIERVRGRAIAGQLGIGALTRAWQMLLKGLEELQRAPVPLQAAEMVLIRLAHAAELPTPAELAARLAEPEAPAAGTPRPPGGRGGLAPAPAAAPPREASPRMLVEPEGEAGGRPRATLLALAAEAETMPEPAATAPPTPQSFAEVVALFAERREAILHAHLRTNLHLVAFEPGRIEFRPTAFAPGNLASRLGACLSEWTGRRWIIAVSGAPGEPTIAEQEAAAAQREREAAARHPLVKAVLAQFPGAAITAVRSLTALAAAPGGAAAMEVDGGEAEAAAAPAAEEGDER